MSVKQLILVNTCHEFASSLHCGGEQGSLQDATIVIHNRQSIAHLIPKDSYLVFLSLSQGLTEPLKKLPSLARQALSFGCRHEETQLMGHLLALSADCGGETECKSLASQVPSLWSSAFASARWKQLEDYVEWRRSNPEQSVILLSGPGKFGKPGFSVYSTDLLKYMGEYMVASGLVITRLIVSAGSPDLALSPLRAQLFSDSHSLLQDHNGQATSRSQLERASCWFIIENFQAWGRQITREEDTHNKPSKLFLAFLHALGFSSSRLQECQLLEQTAGGNANLSALPRSSHFLVLVTVARRASDVVWDLGHLKSEVTVIVFAERCDWNQHVADCQPLASFQRESSSPSLHALFGSAMTIHGGQIFGFFDSRLRLNGNLIAAAHAVHNQYRANYFLAAAATSAPPSGSLGIDFVAWPWQQNWQQMPPFPVFSSAARNWLALNAISHPDITTVDVSKYSRLQTVKVAAQDMAQADFREKDSIDMAGPLYHLGQLANFDLSLQM